MTRTNYRTCGIHNFCARKFYAQALVLSACGALAFVGCTKKEETAAPAAIETAAVTAPADAAAPAAASAPAAVDPNKKPDQIIEIGSDGDNIAFDKKTLTVKAGTTVQVNFKNNVKTSGMTHNWVLVKPGTESDVATEAIEAGETNNWVKPSDKVLAYTKNIKGGETTSVTFIAPPAGDYPYLCTFPGHPVVMKGVLTSQ